MFPAGGDNVTQLVPRGTNAAPSVTNAHAAAREEILDAEALSPSPSPLWFVTLTVAGEALAPALVRAAMERLSTERPFLVSTRYAGDRVELRYWEESDDVQGALSQAVRLWSDHRETSFLPDWRVVGVEAVDRLTTRRRWARGDDPRVLTLGEIRPLDLD